eukprot:2982932-Pleurochrysis_carterae.AAC.3
MHRAFSLGCWRHTCVLYGTVGREQVLADSQMPPRVFAWMRNGIEAVSAKARTHKHAHQAHEKLLRGLRVYEGARRWTHMNTIMHAHDCVVFSVGTLLRYCVQLEVRAFQRSRAQPMRLTWIACSFAYMQAQNRP